MSETATTDTTTDGARDTAAAERTGTDAATSTGSTAGILDPETSSRLEARWNDIQPRFVDDPRDAVADADELVTDTIGAITSSLDEDRSQLEEHWEEGRDPSTEDLRHLMQRYRDLFSRLLDV